MNVIAVMLVNAFPATSGVRIPPIVSPKTRVSPTFDPGATPPTQLPSSRKTSSTLPFQMKSARLLAQARSAENTANAARIFKTVPPGPL